MPTAVRGFLIVTAALLSGSAADAQSVRYAEPWRPGYHFSPEIHWMNEPNGLIYIAGENGQPGLWHLFYQHNPIANQFGRNQSWGHATSPDLVEWTHRPDALRPELTPDGPINAYSGAALFDANNTSGFGTTENPPYILAYTGHNAITRRQDQRLAFSLDRGETWIPYAGNPIIDLESREFRDPKISWDSFYNRWVMIVAHGGQNFVSQWESNDLVNWTRLDDFSDPAVIADGATGWEVPDLFRLPLNGGPVRPWVLQLTPARGSPAGGNGVLYWVGSMGERGFIAETAAQWADFGRDFDGVYSWEEAPDDRRIWAGIMQSYGEGIPTTPWRGQVSFPRELSLVTTPQGARLRQQPVEEIETIRTGLSELEAPATVTNTNDPLEPLEISGRMLDIETTLSMDSATIAGFRVFSVPGGSAFVGYSSASGEVFVDTRGAGRSDFGPIAGVFSAPLDLGPDGVIHLRILLDRSSIEVFAGTPGDPGAVTISQLVLPDPNLPDDQMMVEATALFGSATLLTFRAHGLRETWQRYQLPAGNAAIAHWSMSPPPTPISESNPIVADRATAEGQGDRFGEVSPLYEPSPATDNLYYESSRADRAFVTSGLVPPREMFRSGYTGGDASFDASSLVADDGALAFEPDFYGREFEFASGFTVELFFRTNGNQASAGLMELLLQGDDRFRFALILNEGGPGNLRFAITDGLGAFPVVDSGNADGGGLDLADGRWHYAAAIYDPDDNAVSPAGSLRLITLSESLERREAVRALPVSFPGIRPPGAQSDGRLLVGRASATLGSDERTFLGLIDEIRISDRPLAPSELIAGLEEACAADLDANGQLTPNDIIEYLSRARTEDLTADLVPSSGVDVFDFLEFLRLFDFGCP
ncbi:MAG: glycoside hydrolase family 32 protein [Planctomycetota bacterium]